MSIKFPMEVQSLKIQPLHRDHNNPRTIGGSCGTLVSVRPCGEKYGKKTYVGILLGDLPLETIAEYNRETKELSISGYSNPAIFVPELKEIIWGCESWWEEINSEEELRQISDEDIQNVWYVKMLKEVVKKPENTPEDKNGHDENEVGS